MASVPALVAAMVVATLCCGSGAAPEQCWPSVVAGAGLLLFQSRFASGKVTPGALRSGDMVFLRAFLSGHRVTVEEEGKVQAEWDHQGGWQQLEIEKADGSAGDVMSGDVVFLTGWTGMRLAVEDQSVHAKWDHKGDWQKFTIERLDGDGAVMPEDVVFLTGHTGSRLDADAPDAPGSVQARYEDKGEWQKLVVEVAGRAPTAAPTATASPVPETVSPQAWVHFKLLNDLRAQGFTCPGGATFAPNPVPLIFDCKLWRASYLHSQDMMQQDYFSHSSLDGRSPWDRAREQGTTAVMENVAAGRATPEGALEQFKDSDTHCHSMLTESFRSGAVGHAGIGGFYGHYWTQMFSRSDRGSDIDTSCHPAESLVQVRVRGSASNADATAGQGGQDGGVEALGEVLPHL